MDVSGLNKHRATILETPVDKERDYAWNLRQIRVLSAASEVVGSMAVEREEFPKSLL